MDDSKFSARVSALNPEAAAAKEIANADEARAASFEGLTAIRAAKIAAMQREKTRLSSKLGADDPRVAEMDARIADNAGLVRDIAVETDQARLTVPVVDANTWAVHGYVRDPALTGVKGVNVALYDATGKWLSQYGYNCTDEKGHFVLTARTPAGAVGGPLPGAGGKDPSGKETGNTAGKDPSGKDAGTAGGRTAGGDAAGSAGGTTAVLPVLRVVDQKNVSLFIDRNPVTLQPGAVEYRVFILGSDASACPPPGNTNTPGPGVKG
jgi:hypothetical protein